MEGVGYEKKSTLIRPQGGGSGTQHRLQAFYHPRGAHAQHALVARQQARGVAEAVLVALAARLVGQH